jgi:8-oxo-dGTP pyrophosphatase MutT (NUDIX family)
MNFGGIFLMNEDIRFNIGNKVFNYRVADIIIHNNKVLVQKATDCEYLALVGGRCKICEASKDAALREFKEEIGLDAKIKKEIGMVENFFYSDFDEEKEYHEMLFLFELEFTDPKYYDYEVIETVEEENKERVKYIWVPLEELRKVDFRPSIILDYLDKDNFQHIYNLNRKN